MGYRLLVIEAKSRESRGEGQSLEHLEPLNLLNQKLANGQWPTAKVLMRQ